MQKTDLMVDVECYPNYFLVYFMRADGSKTLAFELSDEGHTFQRAQLSQLMAGRLTVGFNSLNYDLPMIAAACSGMINKGLKNLSDDLITSGKPAWMICKQYNIRPPSHWRHIDLIEVAPGQASLKIYGGRMGAPKLQDLPIEPNAYLLKHQMEQIKHYCRNDLETTAMLYAQLQEPIKLRKQISAQYGIDCVSKSDAQMAEAMLKTQLEREGLVVEKRQIKPGYRFKYTPAKHLKFNSPTLRELLETCVTTEFTLNDSGSVVMPKSLDKQIELHGAKYKMGIGGLHSCEKKQAVKCPKGRVLVDADVASFYPNIILGEQLYPKHIGPHFLTIYKNIVDRRIAAKRAGDKNTANSLKIAINGSYGKFGSKYSFLYSPELMIQTTITGQLSLFMLIEMVSQLPDTRVISANTDGIVVDCPDSQHNSLYAKFFEWQDATGYELEQTYYSAIYSRDVNNYIAVKTDGSVKTKGAYAPTGLMKNPNNYVCVEAALNQITHGLAVEETILNTTDLTKYLAVRQVNGGAVWRGERLGKSVRWYISTDGDSIHYAKNGNKVPKTDGAKPLMNLPEHKPTDIDYQWYIAEAKKILEEIGYA